MSKSGLFFKLILLNDGEIKYPFQPTLEFVILTIVQSNQFRFLSNGTGVGLLEEWVPERLFQSSAEIEEE